MAFNYSQTVGFPAVDVVIKLVGSMKSEQTLASIVLLVTSFAGLARDAVKFETSSGIIQGSDTRFSLEELPFFERWIELRLRLERGELRERRLTLTPLAIPQPEPVWGFSGNWEFNLED